MSHRCSNAYCYAPEVACHLGESTPEVCAAWNGSTSGTRDEKTIDKSQSLLFPWSGNSFGPIDLPFVAGRSSPTVVAIIGPHNAGKTTLLAAWYLLLGRGQRINEGTRFAGSYTLEGWENIAHAFRWKGSGAPTFPPHTASGAGRYPGLLHLALREENGRLADFLFADAPGEWFKRWATDREAGDAAGARWLSEHADVFLFVADCESLVGAERGLARSLLKLLAERLGGERSERPVALVWTKADIEVPLSMRTTIRDATKCIITQIPEFNVSVLGAPDEASDDKAVSAAKGLMELLNWVIFAQQPKIEFPRRFSMPTADPFLAYGTS